MRQLNAIAPEPELSTHSGLIFMNVVDHITFTMVGMANRHIYSKSLCHYI